VAQNIATLLISRALAGFCGAAFLSVAGGTITDLWIKSEISWPMGIYTLGPFLGPTIGPLVGGFINQNTSWRWTFYLIIIWAGVEFLILCFTPETYGPAVLKKKAKYLRREENTDKYKAKIEVEEKSLVNAIGDFCTRPFGTPPTCS
jgi:MFS family permease